MYFQPLCTNLEYFKHGRSRSAIQPSPRRIQKLPHGPELERKIFDSLSPPSSAAETVAVGIELDSRLATVLDRRHFAKAHPALKTRLEALQKYSHVIEVFISSNTAIAALVWGGVKLGLKSVLGFLEPFEKILDIFQEIANTLPRIEIYQVFADRRPSIQSALDKFHIDLVNFLTASVRFLKRHGTCSVKRVLSLPC